MYASNEELLRESECRWPDCVEPAGHAGPHSKGALVPEPTPNWKKYLKPEEREWVEAAEKTNEIVGKLTMKPRGMTGPDIAIALARSLAASRALVEAKNEALRHCRNVHRLAADIIAPAYRGTNNALDEAVGEADAALARTEADISMDEETARIYKEGLIAMHDERHPDGGGLHGG